LNTILSIDSDIVLFFAEHLRSAFLNPVMTAASFISNAGAVWIIFAIAMLFFRKYRRGAVVVLASLAVCFLLNNLLLKNLIARTRPYDVLPQLIPLIKPPTDYSFPSGHTASSFAAAYAIQRGFGKRFGIPAYVLAALIAVSRVYVGVHYPTDVLAGAAIGTICALAVVCFSRRVRAQ
jgi:undecaprenyl-diphosphatase